MCSAFRRYEGDACREDDTCLRDRSGLSLTNHRRSLIEQMSPTQPVRYGALLRRRVFGRARDERRYRRMLRCSNFRRFVWPRMAIGLSSYVRARDNTRACREALTARRFTCVRNTFTRARMDLSHGHTR